MCRALGESGYEVRSTGTEHEIVPRHDCLNHANHANAVSVPPHKQRDWKDVAGVHLAKHDPLLVDHCPGASRGETLKQFIVEGSNRLRHYLFDVGPKEFLHKTGNHSSKCSCTPSSAKIEIKSNTFDKSHHITSNQIKSNRIKSNQSNQIKSNQIKSNRIHFLVHGPNATHLHAHTCCE